MKIVIPGGTGQVGRVLAEAFHGEGHEVVVLSRKPGRRPWRVERWEGETVGAWGVELEGADAVINLAGRSVNCRYDATNRREILESRVRSAAVVGAAIAAARTPPRVWVQASTATIYAHRFDAANDEETGILGGSEPELPDTWRFSLEVARAWEQTMDDVLTPRTRKVKLRLAILMSPEPGGVFDLLVNLVRRGLGGRNGNGRQYVSWIHHEDLVEAVRWIIRHEGLEGAVNAASPHPLQNADFMRALREAAGVPIGLASPEWLLEAGAFLLRTETELVLKSRRVVPGRLERSGWRCFHPLWPEAARELFAAWKMKRAVAP